MGRLVTVALVNRRTVNAELHTQFCFPEVIDDVRKNNRKRRINLQHANATNGTYDYLKEKNLESVSHPPYITLIQASKRNRFIN